MQRQGTNGPRTGAEFHVRWRTALRTDVVLLNGGDWFRQRMSSEVKRAEEGDDELVNHPSQKNQAPTIVNASSPSPPERVATPSARVCLRPGSWRRPEGLPSARVTRADGTSNSDWACHSGTFA